MWSMRLQNYNSDDVAGTDDEGDDDDDDDGWKYAL